MARFEVFGRRKQGDDLTHVGQVHAPDLDAAMLLVRETHFRHEEGIEYALVPSENHGFTPFGPKRERARRKAEERGRGELRRRPVPGRAGGVASKD